MVIPANQPIGIFDSGIGGLTVAKAIADQLPQEQLIYFGDTAHLPYGDKSTQAICQYSTRISNFLLDKGCKAIIIACNTASSFAYHHLQEQFASKVPIINVIDPVIDHVAGGPAEQCVGVIGTKGTIGSDIYARKLREKSPSLDIRSLATALLAPMIEEGFVDDEISDTVIRKYLSDARLTGIQSLILACTHYPIIKSQIEKYYQGKVTVFEAASIVASAVHRQLQSLDLLNEALSEMHRFYVSDYTEFFEKTTKVFFRQSIHLEHYPIWDN